PLFDLLGEREINDAEILGKAMRFGAMFSMTAPDEQAELRLYPKKKRLELILQPHAEPLFGEVTEARFSSLAEALGTETRIRTARRPR
ncbi:MAG: exopolyphosphatase, partial [Halocynthiibacter sp.]